MQLKRGGGEVPWWAHNPQTLVRVQPPLLSETSAELATAEDAREEPRDLEAEVALVFGE